MRPETTLPAAYIASAIYFPFNTYCRFSNEKAEKVVKPPQTPVARKSRQLSAKLIFLKLYAMTIPIRKLPAILMSNVAKTCGLGPMANAQPYLNIPPIAPPAPTRIKLLSTL